MLAIRVDAPGEATALTAVEMPVPTAGADEAVVRVEAAGVNFIDVYKRSGQYRMPLPFTAGDEGAGVVEAVGERVTELKVGDRVAWAGVGGSYAEYAAVPVARLVPLPDGVTTRQGAALMLQGMTAHYLGTSTYPLQRGERCLIHAAAGGVGLLLVQIAKHRGATVIGTAGSDEKAALARQAGADHMIVYTRDDFVAATRQFTDGAGVHVVYDSVGATTFLPGLDVLVRRGMMVLFGQSSGAVDSVDPQLLNRKGSLFLTRPSMTHYVATREELLTRAAELFAWVGSGTLNVRIGAEFSLAQAADAHRALESRQTTGKVLLIT